MYFRTLQDADSGALTYLLADLSAGEAVLVDPRLADAAVLQAMLAEHRLRPRWLLCTHVHKAAQDTTAALQACFEAPVVAGEVSAPSPLLPFGDEHVRAMATRGHTAQCLSFRWRDRLFCGDLLAVGGCEQQPWPLDPAALWDSVNGHVFTLPDETLLFAQHPDRGRAVSLVFEQRRHHPWFGGAGRDDCLARIARMSRARHPAAPAALDIGAGP